MQNISQEDVLEAYKNTDQITRTQMWMRFAAFRKAFDEIDDSNGNKWQVAEIIPRTDWCKKEI